MSGANKNKSSSQLRIPKAPWIYINDPTPDSVHANELAALIPDVIRLTVAEAAFAGKPKLPKAHKSVVLIIDSKSDYESSQKQKSSKQLNESAIKLGTNFASIDIKRDMSKVSEIDAFGTNHLNVAGVPGIATGIYKWLFTVLSVQETLYLIPEEQMKATDDKLFPDYAYCSLSEARLRPKDAKIQFVALVMTKPQIIEGEKLTWTVTDRTGVANFYFCWRGPSSQYTWDWVLSLKPGDRKALPRMPCVEIKEKKRLRFVKAPFRATSAIIGGTGVVIKAVGKGVCKVGRAMQMGPSSHWIPEGDIGPDRNKVGWKKVKDVSVKVRRPNEKKTIDVFNEKGERNWSDDASVASTDVGCDLDEKTGKDFV